jgi:hypothetical protein
MTDKKTYTSPDGHIYEMLSYSVNYFADKKYIGSTYINQPDREKMGYWGRIYHIAETNIKFSNKTIWSGSQYYTEMGIVLGKILNKFSE